MSSWLTEKLYGQIDGMYREISELKKKLNELEMELERLRKERDLASSKPCPDCGEDL